VVSAWRGKHTSLLLTIYWAFLLLALLPQTVPAIEDLAGGAPFLPHLLHLLRALTTLAGLALQIPANKSVLPPGLPPQASASYISLLLFSWLDPLVWAGWKRPLRQQDLPAVSQEVEVEKNTQIFLSRARKQKEARGSLSLWRLLIYCFGGAYFQVNIYTNSFACSQNKKMS